MIKTITIAGFTKDLEDMIYTYHANNTFFNKGGYISITWTYESDDNMIDYIEKEIKKVQQLFNHGTFTMGKYDNDCNLIGAIENRTW